MERLDCVVVGGGVVGLAVARSLALRGRDVVVLEAESQIGMHASSRNSEVIHAGLYYPDDSLKARLCVRGKEMLYAYCRERDIACRRLGKLIVAAKENDRESLLAIKAQAEKNGVSDLVLLDADRVDELEPEVECVAALSSPSTGIIDTHALMTALQAEIEANDGTVLLNSKVSNLDVGKGAIKFASGGASFSCVALINAAGLWAQDLVAKIKRLRNHIPAVRLAKGHYFAYAGKSPFRHLVYPLPSRGGLGVHATNDLSGALRFGPDVEWIGTIDYTFNEGRKPAFVAAIKRYFPALDPEKLVPAYTGIRSKLTGPGDAIADFVIQGEADHGVRGLVNLFGIDSPGLTSSLAIGEYVRGMLD